MKLERSSIHEENDSNRGYGIGFACRGVIGSGSIGSSVEAAQAALKFKDVPSTHWAAAAINSAVEQGFFQGYADGTFKPSSPVTKAEMASILGRLTDQPNAAKQETNNFTDVPEWAKVAYLLRLPKASSAQPTTMENSMPSHL